VWRALARGQRCATKALAGGYGASPPDDVFDALAHYRTSAKER
jgi:hypothetical protein